LKERSGPVAAKHGDSHKRHMTRLSRLAMRGARPGAVYGDAVERDGVTVIPVARTVWGFGGGTGPGDDGAGGGGGGMTVPVGYIRIAGGRANFRPIVSPGPMLVTAALIGLAVARRRR
jgi:uncharacterized spore protein YtfJ